MDPAPPDRTGLLAFARHANALGLVAVHHTAGRAHFKGRIDDRALILTVRRVRRTRYYGEIRLRHDLGWRLWLEIECPSGTRLVVAPVSACSRLTRWANAHLGRLTRLAIPQGLSHLEAWAHESSWGTRLLADPQGQQALLALIPAIDPPRGTAVHWHPDKLGFSTFGDLRSMASGLAPWLAQAARLANLTAQEETVTPPYVPHWTERHPGRLMALFLVGVLITLVAWGALVLVFPQAMIGVYLATAYVIYRAFRARSKERA